MLKPLVDGVVVKSMYVIENGEVIYSWPLSVQNKGTAHSLVRIFKKEESQKTYAIILDPNSKVMYLSIPRGVFKLIFEFDLRVPLELVFLKLQIIISLIYPSHKMFN